MCQDRRVDGLVYVIPIFFVLMGVEALVNRVRFGATRYRLVDSIANLGCGVGQQLLGVFFGVLRVVGYAWVYDSFRLGTIPYGSVAAWVALFLGVDLSYYVFHRVSHRVGFMWAAHVVHHQSEEYNLSVALRQSWLDQLVEWIFYTPFALFGFPPAMFAVVSGVNTLYAFWPHTRAIGRLGPFEWIFNTPSAHRVHHAVNPRYIDKNYASMFVIWDRLFGTYEREREEPVFGTLKPLPGTSPLHANVEPWRDSAQRRAPRPASAPSCACGSARRRRRTRPPSNRAPPRSRRACRGDRPSGSRPSSRCWLPGRSATCTSRRRCHRRRARASRWASWPG